MTEVAPSVEAAIQSYVTARKTAELHDKETRRLKKLMRNREKDLVDAMAATDDKTIKKDQSGLSFIRRNSFKLSVTLANTNAWLDWIRARGKEVEDYTRSEIIAKNLRSLGKEVYDEEGLLAFDDLPVDDTPEIAVLGWKEYMARMAQ